MNLRKNIRNILTKFTNESLENKIKCHTIKLTQEIIDEVNKHETSEQLLRAGGISTEALDRAAYGFSSNDIKTLMPGKLHIKWKEDWKNVKLEQEKSGLSKEAYAKKINIAEPIDVSYEKGKFCVEDGHHRLFAAVVLKKPLNVELAIKDNPITKLSPELSYDEFHRCVFNQIKSKKENGDWKQFNEFNFINEIRNGVPEIKVVYHGTSLRKVEEIKSKGLNAGSMGYQSAGWYMVSTDFASALFHATAEDGYQAPVFEFEVPVDNTKWEGNPFFWPPYERNSDSKWFALKQPLHSKFIKKIHYVDYDDFIKQKNEGF